MPEKQAKNIGKTLEDHANFVKLTYVAGSDVVHPIHTTFTKAAKPAEHIHPEKGTAGNSILTTNEICNSPEDIQANIGRASKAPYFEKFQEANTTYANMSFMGEITFKL